MVATVTDIGSASSTVHYFEQDGYYAKGDPEHRKASFWHGELARALRLARRLEALGYGIAPAMIGPVPGFELEGCDKEVRDAFSTRRRDILEDIRRRGGAYSAARAQQAALYTRRRKAEPAMDELRRIWRVAEAGGGAARPAGA